MKRKKPRGKKKCVTKRKIMFRNHSDCLFNKEIILKLQQIFKSDLHNVYTIKPNKIALSSKGDKRLQTLEGITAYSHRTNALNFEKVR